MTITTVYECQDCGCEWEDDELVCPSCNSGNAVSFEEEVNDYPRSNPRPSATAPISAGLFMMTKPARSRCSTSRLATISAVISSALRTRLRPWKRSAKASASARSDGSAGVRLSSIAFEGYKSRWNVTRTKWSRVVGGHFKIWAGSLFVLPAFLLGASLERGSGSAFLPCPVGVRAEIHYAPSEDLERIDVALIREASKQIDMVAYVLTDTAVIAALRRASARGVKVRIWRDANMAEKVGDYDVAGQLGGGVEGIVVRSNLPGAELMHLKGYCVDRRLLRTGSASFSRSGETRQDNDLVALRGESVCAGFDAKFDRAWGKS
jgi:phosphatidylserine/phosphatidylglycerophosphate/cardiolipin synthase-like enzyme